MTYRESLKTQIRQLDAQLDGIIKAHGDALNDYREGKTTYGYLRVLEVKQTTISQKLKALAHRMTVTPSGELDAEIDNNHQIF